MPSQCWVGNCRSSTAVLGSTVVSGRVQRATVEGYDYSLVVSEEEGRLQSVQITVFD